MNRCLLVLPVLFLAFNAGSALRCYSCQADDCLDPYTGKPEHESNCTSLETHCAKIDFNDGERIGRGCDLPQAGYSSLKDKIVKDFQKSPAGRNDVLNVELSYCNGADFCNGSGRLSEISIKMLLLPASLILLISFFSRL